MPLALLVLTSLWSVAMLSLAYLSTLQV